MPQKRQFMTSKGVSALTRGVYSTLFLKDGNMFAMFEESEALHQAHFVDQGYGAAAVEASRRVAVRGYSKRSIKIARKWKATPNLLACRGINGKPCVSYERQKPNTVNDEVGFRDECRSHAKCKMIDDDVDLRNPVCEGKKLWCQPCDDSMERPERREKIIGDEVYTLREFFCGGINIGATYQCINYHVHGVTPRLHNKQPVCNTCRAFHCNNWERWRKLSYARSITFRNFQFFKLPNQDEGKEQVMYEELSRSSRPKVQGAASPVSALHEKTPDGVTEAATRSNFVTGFVRASPRIQKLILSSVEDICPGCGLCVIPPPGDSRFPGGKEMLRCGRRTCAWHTECAQAALELTVEAIDDTEWFSLADQSKMMQAGAKHDEVFKSEARQKFWAQENEEKRQAICAHVVEGLISGAEKRRASLAAVRRQTDAVNQSSLLMNDLGIPTTGAVRVGCLWNRQSHISVLQNFSRAKFAFNDLAYLSTKKNKNGSEMVPGTGDLWILHEMFGKAGPAITHLCAPAKLEDRQMWKPKGARRVQLPKGTKWEFVLPSFAALVAAVNKITTSNSDATVSVLIDEPIALCGNATALAMDLGLFVNPDRVYCSVKNAILPLKVVVQEEKDDEEDEEVHVFSRDPNPVCVQVSRLIRVLRRRALLGDEIGDADLADFLDSLSWRQFDCSIRAENNARNSKLADEASRRQSWSAEFILSQLTGEPVETLDVIEESDARFTDSEGSDKIMFTRSKMEPFKFKRTDKNKHNLLSDEVLRDEKHYFKVLLVDSLIYSGRVVQPEEGDEGDEGDEDEKEEEDEEEGEEGEEGNDDTLELVDTTPYSYKFTTAQRVGFLDDTAEKSTRSSDTKIPRI